MIRSLCGIVCLVGALGLLIVGLSRSQHPVPPRIPGLHILPPVHDFGDVEQNVVLEKEFVVRNDYTETVTVQSVMKGCSCSEAEVEPKVIPSGGEAKLRVRWEIGRRRGSSSESIAILYLRDGGSQNMTPLKITARAKPVILSSPEEIVFDPTTGGTQVVALSHRDGKPFRVLSIAPSHASLIAKVSDDSTGFEVRFDPNIRGWEFGSLRVSVRTDCSEESDFLLSVRLAK